MTDEAHSRGAKVAAHATTAEGVRNAVLGGVDTIEHGGPLGNTPELVDLMIERGSFLVPTLKIHEVIVNRGIELKLKPETLENFDAIGQWRTTDAGRRRIRPDQCRKTRLDR